MLFFFQNFKYFTTFSSYLHGIWQEITYNSHSCSSKSKVSFPLTSFRISFVFSFLQFEYDMPRCVIVCFGFYSACHSFSLLNLWFGIYVNFEKFCTINYFKYLFHFFLSSVFAIPMLCIIHVLKFQHCFFLLRFSEYSYFYFN